MHRDQVRVYLLILISLFNIFIVESSLRSMSKSLVICGPSGVGKGTLIKKLLESYPAQFALSVSHTTRKARTGEQDGVHYHFVDKKFMLEDIKSGPFKYLEHAQVHSNLYGTREDAVRKIHDSGKVCVLDVDTEGVRQLTKNNFQAKYVFIAPASLEVLEKRLRHRGTETEDQIQIRLKNARGEIEFGNNSKIFDAVVVNEHVSESFMVLVRHMSKWFPDLSLK
jgi:guanylate kinase